MRIPPSLHPLSSRRMNACGMSSELSPTAGSWVTNSFLSKWGLFLHLFFLLCSGAF